MCQIRLVRCICMFYSPMYRQPITTFTHATKRQCSYLEFPFRFKSQPAVIEVWSNYIWQLTCASTPLPSPRNTLAELGLQYGSRSVGINSCSGDFERIVVGGNWDSVVCLISEHHLDNRILLIMCYFYGMVWHWIEFNQTWYRLCSSKKKLSYELNPWNINSQS